MRSMVYLFVALAALASACAQTSESRSDGQTHWMMRCSDDGDCGGLDCVCGVCTQACTARDACALGGEATGVCAVARDVLGTVACSDERADTHACVPACERQMDCAAIEEDLVCVSAHGACAPQELVVTAEGGADADGDGDGDSDAGTSVSGSGGGSSVVPQNDGGGVGGTGSMANTGGMGGMGGIGAMSGTGGMGGMIGPPAYECTNAGEEDLTCPDTVGPFTGSCAPAGACCHRASNSAKIAMLGDDEPQVLEYRVSRAAVLNHPLSLSFANLQMAIAQRATQCAGDQCRLLRFTQPRQGGEPVLGTGMSEIGIGRYNCDGTYSFYDATVAPERPLEGRTDPARWATPAAVATVNPTAGAISRNHVAWAADPNRHVSCIPHMVPDTDQVDWEECLMGFALLAGDMRSDDLDCQGAWTGSAWVSDARYEAFVPLAINSSDVMDSLSQSYCQLLSFSVLDAQDRGLDCLAVPRCMPGTEGCKYVKLPDSLCPETDAERDIFRCHLGAEGNPNGEADYPADLNCTATMPITPLDTDEDPEASAGQCCDPLGTAESGLPACNAFRLVYETVLSAVEITDEPSSELRPVCSF